MTHEAMDKREALRHEIPKWRNSIDILIDDLNNLDGGLSDFDEEGESVMDYVLGQTYDIIQDLNNLYNTMEKYE